MCLMCMYCVLLFEFVLGNRARKSRRVRNFAAVFTASILSLVVILSLCF